VIIEAALRLAASGSPTAVSVRKLGAELGADPTAIYRHFRDKDELMLALLDRLQVRAFDQIRADADWRGSLRAAAIATLEILSDHPAVGVYAGVRTTGGPGEQSAVERTLAAFEQAGLSGEEAVRFYSVYSGFILSFAGAAAAGVLLEHPQELADDDRWIGGLSRVDAARYPRTAEHVVELSRLTDRQVYLNGVDVILDAAAAVAAVSGRPGR
jgi:AcrR family transcriptional regulator